jgi:tetraacyldisaccharide-1-P 4'-kinase
VADAIVVVRDTHDPAPRMTSSLPAYEVRTIFDCAVDADGREVPLVRLARASFGLVLAVARPERIERALLRRGLVPRVTLRFADHARPSWAALEHAKAEARVPFEAWLTTAKCATKLPRAVAGIPVWVLRHELVLPEHLLSWMTSRDPSSPPGNPW